MVGAILVPVEEYLRSTYRPDRDFIDGQLQERSWGEQQHALLQMVVGAKFHENGKRWGIVALPSQRIRISDGRYRVADVCIVRRSDPNDDIVQVPPLLCVEILSPRHSFVDLEARVEDYRSMGVENLWFIDPWQRNGYIVSEAGFMRPPSGVFSVTGTSISVSVSELFTEFDDAYVQR